MRKSTLLLCAAAIGVAACNPAGTSNNAAEAVNDEAPSANTAGTVDSGGAPAAGANAAQSAATAGGEAQPAQVSFKGCPVLLPIEGGCLVVRSGGTTYELNSARPRPDPARRLIIEGTGVPGGISICMAGTPLNNIKWHYTEAKCPIGSDKE